jgi:hypothetical protein
MGRERTSAKNAQHGKKLDAPPSLPERERAVWDAIVKGQSPGWFVRGSEPLLEAHVRCVVFLQALYVRRDELLADSAKGLEELQDIVDLIEKQTRLLAMTSRSLRLTQQSRVRENIVKSEPPKPWEPFGDEDETA